MSLGPTRPTFPGKEFWARYANEFQPAKEPPRWVDSGLSGSTVWRVDSAVGFLALRCWSPQVSLDWLTALHAMLELCGRRRLELVPLPIHALDGRTVQRWQGRLWEVCSWMMGEPAARPADRSAVAVAGEVVARWHALWSPEDFQDSLGPLVDPSDLSAWTEGVECVAPAGRKRAAEYRRLRSIWESPQPSAPVDPLLADLRQRTVTAVRRLDSKMTHWLGDCLRPTTLRFCLGDFRRDHLLLDRDGEPNGLIDFGAVRIDAPITDLSRWLGETAPPSLWEAALEEYRFRLPMPEDAKRSATAFHAAGVVVSALRWYSWILLEGRNFQNSSAARERWREVVLRMELLSDIE